MQLEQNVIAFLGLAYHGAAKNPEDLGKNQATRVFIGYFAA
jgi:hypothetical protein